MKAPAARALRPLALLAALAAFGCLEASPREDHFAETQRMMQEAERSSRSSGGTSQNILVRVERVAASAEDAASLAALWRYADGKVAVAGRDGLATGGLRVGAASGNFSAELSAWQGRARGVERSADEIVVQANSPEPGVLQVTRNQLVPALRVLTPSGTVTVLENAQVGSLLKVRARIVAEGRLELELCPSFAVLSGPKGGETFSQEVLATRVVVASGQKLVLGASSSAANDSVAAGLLGYSAGGKRSASIVILTAERL